MYYVPIFYQAYGSALLRSDPFTEPETMNLIGKTMNAFPVRAVIEVKSSVFQ
jgi:hypothetical protein